MHRKVNNAPAHTPGNNYLLMLAHKAINPVAAPGERTRCRFDMFVRLRPGIISKFKDRSRTWCFRGDKFYDEEYKMLRSLLNHLKKEIASYDRVELYDNGKSPTERVILKLTDGIIDSNSLKQYSLMLLNYPLPEWLQL